MEVNTVACNICGRMKQDTNHWFLAIAPADTSDPRSNGIAFGTSEAVLHDPTGLILEHICGQECLHKRLSRWFDDLNSSTATIQESVTA